MNATPVGFQPSRAARPTTRRRIVHDSQKLAAEILALPSLDRGAFNERWVSLFDAEPPSGLSRTFLTRALAYRMQERVFGGLKPALRKFLAEVGSDRTSAHSTSALQSVTVGPGTVLVRKWHGVTHRVIALENGFEWKGKRYRSLSEVAREISGTRWSGPRFFGLKARAEVSHG